MSYLLVQILICLLIAGLIGAIIGWLLRGGGCDDRLKANDDAWSAKLLAKDQEWESKLQASTSDYENRLASKNSEWERKMQASMDSYDAKISKVEETKSSLEENLASAESKALEAKEKLNSTMEDMDEVYEVETIEGIGPAYGKKLRKIGVNTTSDMVLAFLKDEDNVIKASKEMGVDADAIRAWASMADLMKLPGVGGQFAELMQTVGISSREELATVSATSLHSDMVQFNKRTPIVPKVPTLEELSGWIKIAKNS